MRSNLRIIVLLVIGMAMLGCDDFTEQTPHGYAFQYHLQLGDNKPNFGDELLIQVRIHTVDTVLFESPGGAKGMRVQLRAPEDNPIKEPDPIEDVLPLMGVGDSVTVRMEVSNDMRKAVGLATTDVIYYDVKLLKVLQEEETNTVAEQIDHEALSTFSEELTGKLLADAETHQPLEALYEFVGQGGQQGAVLCEGLYLKLLADGNASVSEEEQVSIRYIACRKDSLLVGESFTNESFSFSPGKGRVIAAWEIAAGMLRPGGKLLMAVPPEKGYGPTGKRPWIAPTDTIYYYFELLEKQ
jgi:FKBP-type peptidyl-prolyl cis-trans isomerase FkpA